MLTKSETNLHEGVEAGLADQKHLRSRSRVLVCDGEQRTALAVVRSLGKRGHEVAVCTHEMPCIAGTSRWAAAKFEVPDPRRNLRSYMAAVKVAAVAWGAEVVMPVTDSSCLALLGERAALAPAVVPGPSLDAFLNVSNKQRLLEQARSMGITTPEQIVIESPAMINARVAEMPGPYAIKAANVGPHRYRVLYANDANDLRRQLHVAPPESFPLLVQRRIVGPGMGVFLQMENGVPVAMFAHERVREQPPSGGASVYCRSVSAPPKLVNDAVRLLQAFNWCGAAMVEFKREEKTGIPYLMEVNGRLWGSLQLAVDAGVDFPALIVDLARGITPEKVDDYAVGISMRMLWGDFDHLLVRMRHSAAALDMPAGTPGRLSAMLNFLRISRHEKLEIFRFDDPRPFAFNTIRYLKGRLGLAAAAAATAAVTTSV